MKGPFVSRREFLKHTALAAGAVSAAGLLPVREEGLEEKKIGDHASGLKINGRGLTAWT